jgi:hypothetical protein
MAFCPVQTHPRRLSASDQLFSSWAKAPYDFANLSKIIVIFGEIDEKREDIANIFTCQYIETIFNLDRIMRRNAPLGRSNPMAEITIPSAWISKDGAEKEITTLLNANRRSAFGLSCNYGDFLTLSKSIRSRLKREGCVRVIYCDKSLVPAACHDDYDRLEREIAELAGLGAIIRKTTNFPMPYGFALFDTQLFVRLPLHGGMPSNPMLLHVVQTSAKPVFDMFVDDIEALIDSVE